MFRRLPVILAAACIAAACSDSQRSTAPTGPSKASVVVTAATCQSELDAVRTAVDTAAFTGKNAEVDEANVRLKVNAAEAKLGEGKPVDAIAKLEDARATVTALSTADAKGKTKLDPNHAAAIIAAIDAAERCINLAANESHA